MGINSFCLIIGVTIGLMLNHLIIKPILRRKAREQCIRDGLVPKDFRVKNTPNNEERSDLYDDHGKDERQNRMDVNDLGTEEKGTA